jgi:hypothetical protein
MRKLVLIAACSALVGATVADAKKPAVKGTPAQVGKLMGCRSIASAEERLACFDREAAAMDAAIAANNLVIVDREQAQAAKRSLFGFSIPNFGGLFGGGEDDVKQIEGTIETVGHNADGGFIFYLADGSIWSQTDDWPGLDPRPGKKVVVKRGVMGSFWLSIPGQNGVKVKRIG